MTELKPCPFCGGEVKKIIGVLREGQMFVCHKCGAAVYFFGAGREPKANKAWNRRVKENGTGDFR